MEIRIYAGYAKCISQPGNENDALKAIVVVGEEILAWYHQMEQNELTFILPWLHIIIYIQENRNIPCIKQICPNIVLTC